MTVDTVGLEPPLLDGGNRRSAQDEVSSNNFQIFDAAIASDYRLQDYRSVKFLRQPFGGYTGSTL